MKKYFIFLCIAAITYYSTDAYSLTGNGNPLKYISSCELDFNNDNEPDIALLIETLIGGRQLIVLMKTEKGYDSYVVQKDMPNMHLSCHFGKSIKETTAGKKEGKIFKTLGTYLKLTQPEGASVAYFWDGHGFVEVWTSD